MIQANEYYNIPGYIGLYKINELGDVLNVRRNKSLKPDMSTPYKTVTLAVNKVNKKILVHRLVAKTFIPNPENKPCVNHKDGNKLNNSIANLEWVTYSENEKHSIIVLGKKIVHSDLTKQKIGNSNKGLIRSEELKQRWSNSRAGISAKNKIPVYQYDLSGSFIKCFDSYTEAAKAVGGIPSAFSALKTGRLKTYKNYIWHFQLQN